MFGHNDQDDGQTDNQNQPVVGGIGSPPPLEPVVSPVADIPDVPSMPVVPPADNDSNQSSINPLDNHVVNDSTNDLIDIKSKALNQLAPLVSHLDQSPEEKFKTTMMMIQASDNQSLVQDAYDAAQLIPDEKAKAQALLDVVNEINYFTQHQAG